MGLIRELPPSLINQIAAGEVVERPASVVKELLENAIDAGATRLEIAVERGGKDLIRVADNGSGISRDDLPLAFRPHATSKLFEADDLFRVRTLGFRGEALAAIAEVSKVRCQSRTSDDPHGHELSVEGGQMGPIQDCPSPVGTVMEVRNLFFNTPVRRTFLRSDATEAGHVVEMVARIALAHPHVHIIYRSSGRVIHDLTPNSGIKDRVAAFLGQELADSLVWIESRIESYHLRGYVAHPTQSRSSPRGQYLFLGGRYVRDRALGHALSEAYRGLLMTGRYPVAFLYLDLPPEEVDVNVHPTKIEVRFRDGHRIYSQVLSTIRSTFLASDLHARLQVPPHSASPSSPSTAASASPPSQPPSDEADDAPFSAIKEETRRQEIASWFGPPSLPGSGAPASGNFFDSENRPIPSLIKPAETPAWASALPPRQTVGDAHFDELGPARHSLDREGPPAEHSPLPPPDWPQSKRRPEGHNKAVQFHDSYLVVETDEGLIVIDQHALHERILYEELRSRVENGYLESQRLLVPRPVDLLAADCAVLLEHRETLERLGLGLEPFGGDTIALTAVPVMISGVALDDLVRDIAEHLRSCEQSPTVEALVQDVLSLIACKAAVKAGQRLSPEEVHSLLERGHCVSHSHHCPHGRPTSLTFTKAELERQFGRI